MFITHFHTDNKLSVWYMDSIHVTHLGQVPHSSLGKNCGPVVWGFNSHLTTKNLKGVFYCENPIFKGPKKLNQDTFVYKSKVQEISQMILKQLFKSWKHSTIPQGSLLLTFGTKIVNHTGQREAAALPSAVGILHLMPDATFTIGKYNLLSLSGCM